MAMDDLIAAAKLRQNDGVLRRWSHYECLFQSTPPSRVATK